MDILPSVSHTARRHWRAVNLPSSGTKSRAESNSWVDTSTMGSSSSGSTQTAWKPAQSLTWTVRLASLAPSSYFPTLKSHLIHLQYSAMVSFAHCDLLSWMQFTNPIYNITTRWYHTCYMQVWLGRRPLYIHCTRRGWDKPSTNLQWSTLKRFKSSVAAWCHGSASMIQAREYGHYVVLLVVTAIAK